MTTDAPVWLDQLRNALDAVTAPVDVFIRDDDAGWADDKLFELLDICAGKAIPIDVAVIPAALHDGLASELRDRALATPGRVGLHQHGFAHTNHEPSGSRKCEFGPARGEDAQRADIASGRDLLSEMLGATASRVFVPPWNRCTGTTITVLRDLGFAAIARDRTATPPARVLPEVPVTVDWFARQGAGELLVASIERDRAVGLMVHHAVMDTDDLMSFAAVVSLLAAHPQTRPRLMADLLPQLPGDGG